MESKNPEPTTAPHPDSTALFDSDGHSHAAAPFIDATMGLPDPDRQDAAVRRIGNRGGIKTISFVPSLSAQRSVWAEGTLEDDFLAVVDTWPGVIDLQHQPAEVAYTFDPVDKTIWIGHSPSPDPRRPISEMQFCRCFPDFLVKFANRKPLLVEVKSARFISDERVVRKADACRLYAKDQGYEFALLSETDIRGARHRSALLNRRYRRMRVEPEAERAAYLILARSSDAALTCAELAERLDGSHPEALARVYAMLAQGRLLAEPVEAMFGPQTIVRRRHIEQDH